MSELSLPERVAFAAICVVIGLVGLEAYVRRKIRQDNPDRCTSCGGPKVGNAGTCALCYIGQVRAQHGMTSPLEPGE